MLRGFVAFKNTVLSKKTLEVAAWAAWTLENAARARSVRPVALQNAVLACSGAPKALESAAWACYFSEILGHFSEILGNSWKLLEILGNY